MPNTLKIAIVTASNSKYFGLVKGLISSVLDGIRELKETRNLSVRDTRFPINVMDSWQFNMVLLDGGLEDYEQRWLHERGVNTKKLPPDSLTLDYDGKELPATHMHGYTERHALPTHFPGYDIYLWIDADAWVQDFKLGIMPYLLLAARGHLAIVPEVDRQIVFNAHHRKVTKGWSHSNYTKFFGEEIAKAYGDMPTFNNGVFAARATNPIWKLWESAMQFALDKNNGKPEFGIDQISMNFVIYGAKEVKTYPLSLLCNWMVTHAVPMINDATNTIVTPLWPHNIIGIIHLLDYTKWNRVGIQRINTTTLSVVSSDSVNLEYGWAKRASA